MQKREKRSRKKRNETERETITCTNSRKSLDRHLVDEETTTKLKLNPQ
jgi:hypothetical protein